ncbi:MAG TPA: tRNA 2-thiouridine(34) synthase MnmA [Chitinivibrionales bacterium]|nr:tRNA 2-thiouridine(34) synthase MnmA [Chitinivibrionales bacterium]
MAKILVAMSGGVDSSVAAALLAKQGHEVTGVTMKLLDKSASDASSQRSCCGFDSSRDAKLVADAIGIPHYTVNAVEVFSETVMRDFFAEYHNGRTPNPCVRCNRFVKFDFLMKKADELGCEFLATGHYAKREGRRLYKGADEKKDQSYFLYVIYEAAIERILFPLGGRTKTEIRGIASKLGLVTAKKPESQDICFVENGKYFAALEPEEGHSSGPIVDCSGKILGRHHGIFRYTVGQHKGLGSLGRKMFVKEIRPADNTVVVGLEDELFARKICLEDVVIAGGYVIDSKEEYDIQVRYRGKPVKGLVSSSGNSLAVSLAEPVRAIAPGQSAVVYDGEMVVGGGVIDKAE